MMDIRTDFEFKDARTYINSSSLCEFLVERVMPEIGLDIHAKLDARFHLVATRNGVMRCQTMPIDPDAGLEVTAEFRLESDGGKFYVYFIESDEPVGRRVSSNYDVEGMKLNASFEGDCRIKIDGARSLFENVIEANKRVHQLSFEPRQVKVVNAYMRKFPLALLSAPHGWYDLKIRNAGTRTHNEGTTTLNKLSFVGLDTPEFEMCYLIPGAVL
jgi:hypothetical protein